MPSHDSTLVSINSDKEATRSVIRLLYKEPKRSNTTVTTYRQHLMEGLFGGMFNDRFSEIIQKPNPPFINAFAAQGDLVRSAESFSLTAIVADNGIPRGLNALLTEGERVRRFGFLQSELDRTKKDFLRGIEQAYAEREKTNSSVYAATKAGLVSLVRTFSGELISRGIRVNAVIPVRSRHRSTASSAWRKPISRRWLLPSRAGRFGTAREIARDRLPRLQPGCLHGWAANS